MENQTIYIIAGIAVVILILLWLGYRALRRYSCCGTCGCEFMTKKDRKAYDARRANLVKMAKEKAKADAKE